MGLRLAATSKNYLPHRGISILEKLIKTCPVWLQLGLDQAEVTRILHREVAGVSQQQQGAQKLCGEASAITQLPVCSLFSSQSAFSCRVSQSSVVDSGKTAFCFGEYRVGGRWAWLDIETGKAGLLGSGSHTGLSDPESSARRLRTRGCQDENGFRLPYFIDEVRDISVMVRRCFGVRLCELG